MLVSEMEPVFTDVQAGKIRRVMDAQRGAAWDAAFSNIDREAKKLRAAAAIVAKYPKPAKQRKLCAAALRAVDLLDSLLRSGLLPPTSPPDTEQSEGLVMLRARLVNFEAKLARTTRPKQVSPAWLVQELACQFRKFHRRWPTQRKLTELAKTTLIAIGGFNLGAGLESICKKELTILRRWRREPLRGVPLPPALDRDLGKFLP
jgi:hypothetical protein